MKFKINKLLVTALAATAFAGCATTKKVSTLDPKVESKLGSYFSSLQEHRSEQHNLISPEAFRKAENIYESAREKAYSGAKFSEVSSLLNGAEKHFDKMDLNANLAQVHLSSVLNARAEAVEEGAENLVEFKDGDKELKVLGYELESADINEILEEREEVRKLFVKAEVLAIQNRVLAVARENLEMSEKMGVSKHFNDKRMDVEKDISSAMLLVERFKDSPSRYKEGVATATDNSKRLFALAETAKWVRDTDTKKVVLGLDRDLNAVLEPLTNERPELMSYKEKVELATAEAMEVPIIVGRLSAEQYKNYVKDRKLRNLRWKNQEMSAELSKDKALDKKLQQIRQMFKENEAKIVLEGDDLVIRLIGLNFPVNKAELPKNSKTLLTKVAKAAEKLDYPSVKIVGHADSTGDALYNERLSEKRAKSVENFLVKNSDLDKNKTETTGAGFRAPVSENKTDVGRKMNRRIDLVFNKVVQ